MGEESTPPFLRQNPLKYADEKFCQTTGETREWEGEINSGWGDDFLSKDFIG